MELYSCSDVIINEKRLELTELCLDYLIHALNYLLCLIITSQ